jgi:RNA polymerase sigma-70 factor (ECF subfamily)
VEDDVLTRLGTETVHRMCAGLPADQRSVLLLRVLADLTVEQVAAVMDRSVGSVKALQRRGLRRLRAELEPAGTPRTGETGGTAGAPLSARAAMTGAR